jgi:glutamate dehydrogenase
MADDAKTDGNGLIREVQQMLGPATKAAQFAALLYGRDGRQEIEGLAPARLAREARDAVDFITEKPKDRHKIGFRRMPAVPAEGLTATTVLEVLNDDMPFLVDSVLGEVAARGLEIGQLQHPIFKTRRDRSGRLEAIAGPGDGAWGDGHQESYIAVHLPALSEATAAHLGGAVSAILRQVRVVVSDWKPMLHVVKAAVAALQTAPASIPQPLLAESIAFLQWLERDNFTFLGMRELELSGDAETGNLVPVAGSELGVLRDASVQVLRRGTELVAMTPEVRRFFFAPSPLIITKANVVSKVHRRAHMDYIGIKTYRADGTLKGEIRVVGLFTSQSYFESPTHVPFLRHKVEAVFGALGYAPSSHDSKAVLNILESFPRDELFQIGMKQLREWAEGILDLETRPRVRVFARVDRFDRFVSLLVYVPRDRYTSTVRERIGALLSETYDGRIVAFYPHFTDGPLVRVQFIVARDAGATPQIAPAQLERGIIDIIRTWQDRLAQAIAASGSDADAREKLESKYGAAFSAGYAETFTPERALEDIKRIERLDPDRPVAIDFYSEAAGRVHAAIYRFGPPMQLSERVPILENLGFSAIDERTYHITPRYRDGVREVTLHDMALQTLSGDAVDLATHGARLEEAFLAVFQGLADNDGFNRLVVSGGADWREAAILRAYAAYLRQLGSPFGLRYLAETLNRHAGVSRDLLELFHLRLNPERKAGIKDRDVAEAPIRKRIDGALGAVPSLDEDRILRQFLSLVAATVRTNFYQTGADGRPPETITFKFDGKALEPAPQPRPYREIWVYSPRVEGVHLRFGPTARGGIRWSDRAQDFRTEILGLVRAQRVKNAVIVPTGAKGGFLPKQMPRTGGRDAMQAEGIAAYRIFISALLDVTDNVKDGAVVGPTRVVRHDGDDPYLVVAADKGTATFSDIANDISLAHGFWLGDAFASGGSAGYDHKKMGITARGAWECVKRHFHEMDVDIQRQPFRVVGVGDMSGDVFGNGMLLSPEIRLVAAFDHRDIFLDPEPDAAAGLAERQRLFDLPRSSWQDYDKAKISKGGGVFSRAAKSIALSAEIRELLDIDVAALTPAELIRAILKCRTDLLWFGGIGTYVRASDETEADAGDRANDALRVTGAQLRAKVVGEGANLGMTQRGRIEFAAHGGRLNTDFIDNSAGVNTSDQEVNIKIVLGPAVRAGRLTTDARNHLLTEMTEDVAANSLRNNYQQSLALSLAERRSLRDLPDYPLLMRSLEARGLLDRLLEALPSDEELLERAKAGRGLKRPELAVLLSYAKIALSQDLLDSKVPDEPLLASWLTAYFPARLQERFATDIKKHILRREIIATGLTNAVVNRGGPVLAMQMTGETGHGKADVALGFMAAREVFELPQLWPRIDAMDGKLGGAAQLSLYEATQELVRTETLWFLHDGQAISDLAGTIARHSEGLAALRPAIEDVLPARLKEHMAEVEQNFLANGVPADLAADVARLEALCFAPAITEIAAQTRHPILRVARVFFEVGEHFRIRDLIAKAAAIGALDTYDRLAIGHAVNQLAAAQAAFTRDAIGGDNGQAWAIGPWLERFGARLHRAEATLDAVLGRMPLTIAQLSVAAGQLSELAGPAVPAASASTGHQSDPARSASSESLFFRKPWRQPRS